MDAVLQTSPGSEPLKTDFREADALAQLTEVLAVAFSAASEEERRMLTSAETLARLDGLMALANLSVARMSQYAFAARELLAREQGSQEPSEAVLRYRREMSRLFYQPPRMAVLEGRKWVSLKHKTEEAHAIGERAAVAREYARQGLRVVPGASEAEDCLQYELEYMAWLIHREARALEARDTAQVLKVQGLRRHFAAHHLGEFCRGVAIFTSDHSDDPVLRYYAQLLYLVATRFSE